jgi:hypothetical protein
MTKTHFLHYLILFLIFLLALFGLAVFRFRPQLQLIVVGLSILGYIFWGVFHAAADNRLRREVVGEYILIGLLAFVLFALLLLH